MNQELVDFSLLHDDSDSRRALVRAKISNLSKSDLSFPKIKQYEFSMQSVSDWLDGKYTVPLVVLKNPNKLFKRTEYFCCGKSNKKVKFTVNYSLAYFLGVVFGDGHIIGSFRPSKERRFGVVIQKLRSDYSEFYLPNLIHNIFSVKPKIFLWKRKNELVSININSKVIYRIFTNLFNFSHGKKSDKVIDRLKDFDYEFKKHFIAGFFDTDGGRASTSIALCNSSKKAIDFVKTFLDAEEITYKIYSQSKGIHKWYILYIIKKDKNKLFGLLDLKNERKFAADGARSHDL